MGLGLWTSEELKYHPLTGELLTKNTWVICIYEQCKLKNARNYIVLRLMLQKKLFILPFLI